MSRSSFVKRFGEYFVVHIIPIFSDNYAYVVQCCQSNEAAIIDIGDASPVLKYVQALGIENEFSVLTTHKHTDHSGGNRTVAQNFRSVKIFGGALDNVPGITNPLNDLDEFNIGVLTVRALHTPCHTRGHMLYHVFHKDNPRQGALFTGDTIFVGGLGAFFEGNAADMAAAVRKIIQLVPPETAVFPGHEYTINFLRWAVTFERENEYMAQKLQFFERERKEGRPTLPSTIADERRINLFMRVFDDDLQGKTGIKDPVKLMEHLYNSCP